MTLETNIEPIDDYKVFRQETDDSALVNEFVSEFETPAKEKVVVEEKVEAKPEGGLFKRFAKDVARGTIGEGPRAIVSGVTKGLNEMADTVDDFNQFIGGKFAKGVLSVVGTEEQQARGVEIVKKKQEERFTPVLQPTFGVDGAADPKSVTGNIIEGVAEFLTGFGVAGKALKGVKAATKTGKAAKRATQAGIGDVIAFDEQEERLSSVIEGVPALQNPVTEFLQSEEDDSVAEAKFKQAIEGVGLGVVGEGLGKAISILRKSKKIKNTAEAQLGEAAEPGLRSENLQVLGRPESNEFVFKKVQLAKEETEGLTAKQIEKLAAKKPASVDDIQINFARIDGPEDIKNAMQAFANETKLLPKVKGSRRGVRSNEVTLKDAEDIDGFKTLMERREGQPLNAEQTTAARNFYYNTTDKLMELAKKASSPEASDVDQYAFRKMVATHHAVQKEVLGARAEAGRALQAWSIPATGTPSEKLKGMEAILDSFGGAEASKDLARRLASFGDGQLTSSQINTLTQKSAYARSGDAIVEAWTAGLLTNPVTHVKNLTSNTLTTLMGAAERYSQALFPQSEVTIAEANSFVMGLIQSQKEAFANAGRAFRTGQVGFGQSKIELPRTRASSKEILDLQGLAKPFGYAMDYYGRMVNTSFKALAAGDEYSKTILFNAQRNALATRQGLSDGLRGNDLKDFVAKTTTSPNASIDQQARDFADYATFTKELGKSGKSFQRILSQNPALKFVVPFYKTPVNIFKYTLERTPLAPLSSEIRKELGAGGTREAAVLAKIGMGSSIMSLGVDAAINGNITGAGPSDPKKRAALRRLGWQPNSIKVGDNYYSYQGLEPASTLFAFSSNMAEIMTNYEMYDMEAQDELEHLSTATVMAVTEATVNKTFLQGISNIMEAASDPERFAPSYIQRTLSSFVPSGSAAIERAVDPSKEYVTNVSDALKARIPGFSSEVARRRNVYGEEIKYRSPDENVLDETVSGVTSLFNPFYKSTLKDDPLDEFLLKEGYFINMPSKSQTFDNVQVNLRDHPEIYSRLVELRGKEIELIQYGGENMKTALTDLVTENSVKSIRFFSDFTDREDKQNMLTKITRDYNDAAKEILLEEFPVLDQIILDEKLKQEQQQI